MDQIIKRIIFLFILISICSTLESQIIRGIVKDQYSNEIVNYAQIYFNGTFNGTNSDQNGHFELDVSKNLSMPLTISALGYYTVTLTQYSYEKELLINLTPKVFELKEVIVTSHATPGVRRLYLHLFKKEFLGQTINSWGCKILNEKDIIVSYDSLNEILRAYATKPIQIDNEALGYKITYYLDNFEYCKKNESLILTGNYIFKEDVAAARSKKDKFERKRRTAYLGSRMHFIRSLWGEDFFSSGFTIQNRYYSNLSRSSLVFSTDSITKYLHYREQLYIGYYKKTYASGLKITKDRVFFDKNGYFDPLGISWTGEMAKQRMADLLPYEYTQK